MCCLDGYTRCKRMKITLLGLEFASANLGCAALAYSFANEVAKIAKDMNIELEYNAVVFDMDSDVRVPYSGSTVHCMKIRYKKIEFWRNLKKLFKESDLIVDFTGGDSFSDIYGKKRFYMATIIKMMAINSKATFVLGPQTYGPYKRFLVKKFAKWVIKNSTYVFARDEASKEFASKLAGRDVKIAPDVAFALPYDKKEETNTSEKIRVGINISGLLWYGGYKHAKLPLTVDYQEYNQRLIEKLSKDERYEIHLITHVGREDESIAESDYAVCSKVHKQYPHTILAKVFKTPMDAKSYIADMDIIVGARMHATIAGVSTKVATIPFSYSRKFEGLYDSIGYDYVIHACSQTTDEAVEKTYEYITKHKELKENIKQSMEKIITLQGEFEGEMRQILNKVQSK